MTPPPAPDLNAEHDAMSTLLRTLTLLREVCGVGEGEVNHALVVIAADGRIEGVTPEQLVTIVGVLSRRVYCLTT